MKVIKETKIKLHIKEKFETFELRNFLERIVLENNFNSLLVQQKLYDSFRINQQVSGILFTQCKVTLILKTFNIL